MQVSMMAPNMTSADGVRITDEKGRIIIAKDPAPTPSPVLPLLVTLALVAAVVWANKR